MTLGSGGFVYFRLAGDKLNNGPYTHGRPDI